MNTYSTFQNGNDFRTADVCNMGEEDEAILGGVFDYLC